LNLVGTNHTPHAMEMEMEAAAVHRLSDDALALVFGQLQWSCPSTLVFDVPRVCRRWQRVCKERVTGISMVMRPPTAAWNYTIDINKFMGACKATVARFLSTDFVGLILSKSVEDVLVAETITHPDITMFTSITLTHGCAGTCLSTLTAVAQAKMPNLRSLTIRHYKVRLRPSLEPCQDEAVDMLCRNNPGLQQLTLDGWHFTDAALESAGRLLPALVRLGFGRSQSFSDEAMAQLVTTAPLLKASSIKSLSPMGAMALRALGRTRGPTMRVIKTVVFRPNVAPADIAAYVRRCPNARSFVTDGIALDDEVLRAVASVSPGTLTRLGLVNKRYEPVDMSRWYTTGGLMALLPLCVHITVISFVACPSVTDSCLATLCRVAPISKFEVTNCIQITGNGVAYALGLLAPWSRMRELWIEDCPTINDTALHLIKRHTPNLRHLNIWESSGFTEAGLVRVLRGWNTLEGFHTQSCLLITDLITGHLSLNAAMCSLDLDGAENLTDVGGKMVMEGFPNLEELSFRLCLGITDVSFVNIGCPKLQAITLNYVHNITNAALEAVTNACPALREVRVRETRVDESGVRYACTYALKLTVLLWSPEDDDNIGNVRKDFPRVRM
jgi:hypothetical protein